MEQNAVATKKKTKKAELSRGQKLSEVKPLSVPNGAILKVGVHIKSAT